MFPSRPFDKIPGITAEAIALEEARHRLLEGVLLRLAQLPDAGGLVLRGGVLLRHWFGPEIRPALDLDLVAPAPLTVEKASRYLPLFADSAIADGVTYEAEEIDMESIWLQTDNPGVRFYVWGNVGEIECDFHVDITGGPPPQPTPVFGELPTLFGQPVRVWMCRPESVVGQKLQALWHLGMLGWRPKDLHDLRMLLERVSMDRSALHEAIAASFAEMGGAGNDARALFGPSAWWGMKFASSRWHDFVTSSPRHGQTETLASVVAEVTARLAPVLEELP